MKSDLDLSYFGYRLPPAERFGFVNYFAILGQYTESGLFVQLKINSSIGLNDLTTTG